MVLILDRFTPVVDFGALVSVCGAYIGQLVVYFFFVDLKIIQKLVVVIVGMLDPLDLR